MFGSLRFYRNSWRKAYIDAFDKYTKKFLETNNHLKFKKSACGRFYVSCDDWIVIRIDLKTAGYLGRKNHLNKDLTDMMKYYNDKLYNIIKIDVYGNYRNPKMNMKDDVKNYLESIKLLRQ